jgi:hypothetical protein
MSTTVTLVLVILGVVLIAAGMAISWRRASVRMAGGQAAGRRLRAAPSGDEFVAAPASEAIEERVNRLLAAVPGQAESRVDFGTAADGSLEIWIGEERYTSIEEVRDPRVRQAIQDAVAAYNAQPRA